MAFLYALLVIAIQALLVHGEHIEDEIKEQTIEYTEPELLSPIIDDDIKVQEPNLQEPNLQEHNLQEHNLSGKDFYDMFFGGNHFFFPSSSVSLMSQITDPEKPAEEQLADIKKLAEKISAALQHEMVNLMSYVCAGSTKESNEESTKERKRRSAESPMDSTKLVMRLLKHIKSNNEYQNIAIEKMMSAQEIADKFGIEFNPDSEILSDLAVSANNHAKELTDLLKDTCTNSTEKTVFVPLDNDDDEASVETEFPDNDVYYVYAVYHPDQKEIEEHINTHPSYEFMPEQLPKQADTYHHHHQIPIQQTYQPNSNHHDQKIPQHHPQMNNNHPHHHHQMPNQPQHQPMPMGNHQHHNQIHETQIPAPPQQFCSTRNVFEPPVTPVPDVFLPVFEPITTTTTIILPIEEMFEPEPELVGEEFEETVSSKVLVDHDAEPGSATVNHVMTYTVSEKAHYKTPQVETLPQQMKYSFYLM